MYHISSIQERNVQWWGWKQTDLCQNPAVRWNRVTFLDDVKFYQKNIKKKLLIRALYYIPDYPFSGTQLNTKVHLLRPRETSVGTSVEDGIYS